MPHEIGSEKSTVPGRVPLIGAGRTAVREQLERMLDHPLFKQSKRYSAVLRYLVDRALQGANESDLKERNIGIDALGRGPSFDTNLDPTVRVVISEIRKRLTLYYQQSGHESEVLINLHAGSYVPEFLLPGNWKSLPAARHWWSARIRVACLAVAGAAVLAGSWMLVPHPQSALDMFWAPVLKGNTSVLLCIGERPERRDSSPTLESGASSPPVLSLSDVVALLGISDFLQSRRLKHPIRAASITSVTDLRGGPSVLVGLNNYWTQRFTGEMRFRHRSDPSTGLYWIEDQRNPSRKDWSRNVLSSDSGVTADYALVTRALDSSTGQMVVTLAGLSSASTMAAGEFLVDATLMERAARQAPKGWEKRNLEFVIKVETISRRPSAPQVLASYFW